MRNGRAKVVLAHDCGLIFSDDYLAGWKEGFEAIGCEVVLVDIAPMRSYVKLGGRQSIMSMRGVMPKMLAQNVKAQHPDLVFIHHGRAAANDAFINELRKAGIRTAVYLCDEPYECGETALYAPKFDYVFTMDPGTVRLHERKCKRVLYLPPGASVEHFKFKPYEERDGYKAFFLGNGTLTPRSKYLEMIDRLVEGAEIRYFKATMKNRDEWIPYEDHPRYYGNCLVGLNIHRSPWMTEECWRKRADHKKVKKPEEWGTGFWNDHNMDAHHWNPRFLEMAACGTLVVNDDSRTELAREFPYIPRAKSPEDFYKLVLYYLDHQDEASEIGRACHYHVSRRHTYPHRAAEVLTRCGLKEGLREETSSFLGAPEDWLTPQDIEQLTARSSSEQIGRSEPWHPRFGKSLIGMCGSPKDMSSIDTPRPWLS